MPSTLAPRAVQHLLGGIRGRATGAQPRRCAGRSGRGAAWGVHLVRVVQLDDLNRLGRARRVRRTASSTLHRSRNWPPPPGPRPRSLRWQPAHLGQPIVVEAGRPHDRVDSMVDQKRRLSMTTAGVVGSTTTWARAVSRASRRSPWSSSATRSRSGAERTARQTSPPMRHAPPTLYPQHPSPFLAPCIAAPGFGPRTRSAVRGLLGIGSPVLRNRGPASSVAAARSHPRR